MASSMLTAEALSASASKEVDVDKALKTTLHSCANDPDFAIICDFLQKFAKDLGLDLPNFKLLLQWLTKTDEVSPQLRDMQIKLLRKTRKTVHEKSWESALSKFCFTYSAQDGWEIERFGYKNSSVKVKLRILRELLECQFERNTKFRARILTLSADSLRSKPIGRDSLGHAYWVTQDKDCNIHIYQEHLDEEIWQVVATNRDEFVNLISRLKGSEVVMPCKDISIVDEDTTSSSSEIGLDSLKKAAPPEENDDSQEGQEQKVPKLSIKIFHGNDVKETTNTNDFGKGEEELASEEDAKLLKKSTASSDIVESDEEEFEEVEEEHDDESDSELESEDEINNKQSNSNKNETVQKLKETLKSEHKNKKVKPLLISQNKVLSNESGSSSNASKKRALNQVGLSSPYRSENQQDKIAKKSKLSLLDSKRLKTANSYEEMGEEGYEESALEDTEVEEELEEEDIDSAAAEEDENEEKLFDDYDDDQEEVGEEICDPIIRVSGEGSGKDCDVENYLYCIDFDLQIEGQNTFSEIIIEDLCYIRGEGCGVECLVGNDKINDNILNSTEKNKSEKLETIVEIKSKYQSENPLAERENNTSSLLENTESSHLGTSRQVTNESKNVFKDSDKSNKKYDEISNEASTTGEKITKEINSSEDVGQINGENKTLKFNETFQEKQSVLTKTGNNLTLLSDNKNLQCEKISKTFCEEENQVTKNNLKISNVDTAVIDGLTHQAHANKMSALESLKKELRESKQKLLEKKLPQASESSGIKSSCTAIYNRKRRLTEQQKTLLPNSESEIDLNFENTEEVPNDKELKNDEIDKDVGGKRLKMRPKQTNTELRKKIEAQKIAANDETTSSSGGEEELVNTNKYTISPKQSPDSIKIKSDQKLRNCELKKDSVAKGDKASTKSYENQSPTTLSQQLSPIKKAVHNSSTKIKPALVEVIEEKLKRSTEKVQHDLNATNNDNKMLQPDTVKKQIPSLKKSPITKPLKKSLLTQVSQEESDDNVVPPKCSNSQDLDTPILSNVKSFASAYKTREEETMILKSDNKTIKSTPERQRKRRSSEETVQSESAEEPEAKKEVTVVEKIATRKHDKNTQNIKEDVMKKESKVLKTQKVTTTPVSGRRSGRRGGVAPNYVDTSQPKKERTATKNSSKKNFNDYEKDKPRDEKSQCVEKVCSIELKQDVVDKSNIDKLPHDKLIQIPKEDIKTEYLKPSLLTKTPLKGVRKQHEVDANNIIDKDSETPVRQSRRIAQQKIREEAERRKLEEIALRTMKQELKKKKKAEKQADPTVVPPTEPSSESEESDVEVKRKVQKKKCPGKNGNWSSGSEEQEEPEEDDEEPPHYDTDPGSPLFKSDHEFSPESDIEDESQVVPMKRARTVRKEDGDADSVAAVVEEEACQKCKKSDHPEWILLCDNCDKGYHCSCLSPVLFYIPEGDWYCPPCQQEQLIKALENQLKEFDDLVENKKKADEQEKRMAEEEKARQEREEETNKQKTKKDKQINTNRDNGDSSADDHSQNNDEEPLINSDDSRGSDLKRQSGKNKNRNRLRKFKSSDKRNHRDSRNNTATRSRRNRLRKHAGDSDSDTQHSSQSSTESKSNSSSSSTYSESDNEPIYKLRKRRQINVSYRLNEYDDLINSALKKEMDEAAGAGNLGRGKDISTIIEADKEEKARLKHGEGEQKSKEVENDESIKEKQNSFKNENDEKNKDVKKEEIEEDDSDAEPIMRKFNIKPSQKKKSRKLTTLDISSEDDDGSDEDFKGSSFDDDDEEDTSISASNSDSSLEIYKRHGKLKKKRRRAARRAFRERRKDRMFVVDESDDEDLQRPKSKKKRKDDSDYTESEADDDDISELSENIDSADLCDDTTTDESDGAWRPNKRKIAKKTATSFAQKSPKSKNTHAKKHKKVEYSDDDVSETEDDDDEEDVEGFGSGKGMGKQPRSQPLKSSSSLTKTKGKGKEKPPAKAKKKKSSEEESSKSDSEDSTRRTRGRRYAYIEDFDDDSSDGGIKPGVQRPDTPPEEREKFIKRQEEIKRMLAEKNAEGAKLAATPRLTPIKTDSEKDKRSPAKAGDSLSTVPLSVIRQAKVLDIDYLQRRGENLDDLSNEVGEVDDFDDADLPDDLPEDMDEDAIARMVEEEEDFGATAVKELPAPDEVLRTPTTVKSNKVKELEKPIVPGSTTSSLIISPQVTAVTLPTPTSGLQEPVRKRLPMPTMHPPLLRHQILRHDSMPSANHLMQRHGNPHTSHLLQNALSAPLTHSLDRQYASTSQHSLINRMAHSIALQPTVSHALNTTRPSQPQPQSVITKSPPCIGQPSQEKSANPQIVTENKPRGRRKKITPLRDTLQKQQTAAAVTAATATNSALASSIVKNNETVGTSLLSGVIKSGPSSKFPMQASVITSMPPTSHGATNRAGVPIPPITGSYVRNDGPRFYDPLGTRISQGSAQRHRGPPQMPPSLLPPHPANRSSYGLPPPLKGSNSGSQVSSTSASIRNPIRHVPTPYLGMPPNARHASHLNMYRPPIYGNPNFGPRVNLRPPNIHPSDYSTGSRAYPPYGFYPPPPPLTTPGQRSGPPSVPRPTQIPPIQSTFTHPPATVIVSATSSKSSNSPTVTLQSALPTSERNESSSSSKTVVATQESSIKFAPAKPSSPTPVIAQAEKPITSVLTVAEPRKKLTTLQAYTASSAKQSLVLGGSDSSSQSPPDPSTELNDDSSTPGTSEITNSAEQPTKQDGKASEFSGLVSYFSSQHDDYNT